VVGQDQTVCYNRCIMGGGILAGVRGTEVEVLGKEEGGSVISKEYAKQRVCNEAVNRERQ